MGVSIVKKIAILGIFPVHCLKSFGRDFRPEGHYATWLPQIAEAWQGQTDFEIHWLTGSALVDEPLTRGELNQTFHVYPIAKKGRAASFYRRDRQEIQKLLAQIQPELVHAWGTEDVCGFAGVRSGYPSILSLQGIHTNLIRHGLHHPRVYFQALLEAYCLARADWVTVESAWGEKKSALFDGGDQSRLWNTGFTPVFFGRSEIRLTNLRPFCLSVRFVPKREFKIAWRLFGTRVLRTPA